MEQKYVGIYIVFKFMFCVVPPKVRVQLVKSYNLGKDNKSNNLVDLSFRKKKRPLFYLAIAIKMLWLFQGFGSICTTCSQI